MTKPLLLALALMLCGNPAIAVDNIGIYSDEAGVCCNLTILVSPPAYNSLYIIHEFNNDGSVASQFKVNDYSGLFAASQSSTFLTLGTWNTDLPSPIVVISSMDGSSHAVPNNTANMAHRDAGGGAVHSIKSGRHRALRYKAISVERGGPSRYRHDDHF